MSKKNKNANKIKLFDKKADILTDTNDQYHIRKNRIYICGPDYYGKVLTITSNKYNKDNIHIIKEIYPEDNNRFRFLMQNYGGATIFRTIERSNDGSKETPIWVIENYKTFHEYICSIGGIKSFKSDLEPEIPKKDFKLSEVKILKLILPKNDKDKEKGNKKRVS